MESILNNLGLIRRSVCDTLKNQPIYQQLKDIRLGPCSGLENIANAREMFENLSSEEKQLLDHFVLNNDFDEFFIQGDEIIFQNHIRAFDSLIDKGIVIVSGDQLDVCNIKPIIVEVVKENLQRN
jgi:hypothetical protein